MSLVDKYAPKTAEDLVGKIQQNTARALLKGVETGNITQKILFCGTSGVGKTSISKIYANALSGTSDSIVHVNCKENSGVGFIRDEVLPQLSLFPIFGGYRILFLDEIHGLSADAQDALLIRLENLPSHVVILAATTDPKKLKPALSSRLNPCNLPTPTRKELTDFLLRVFKEEGIGVEGKTIGSIIIKPDLVGDMLNKAAGNVRSLLNFVEQVLEGYYNDSVDSEETPLLKLLFNRSNRQEIFKAAENISDYNKEAVGICNYVIKVLKSKHDVNCVNLLRIFGKGLSPHTYDKVSFYHLLNQYIEEG